MSPLFKKLNLGAHTVIHVLNAPASFEPELASLQGIAVRRSVSGRCSFALAFVITQAQLDAASDKLARACEGDAVLWMVYPKGTSRNYKCEFNRDSGWKVLGERGVRTGSNGRRRRRLVGVALSQGRAHQIHGAQSRRRHFESRPTQGFGPRTVTPVKPASSTGPGVRIQLPTRRTLRYFGWRGTRRSDTGPQGRSTMKIFSPLSPLFVAGGWLLLSIVSHGARAADPAAPEPHWSGLPIWGAEAEARGYQLPLPFGIGVTAYSARQPVDIQDLQLGRKGNAPVSVTNFLQINRVDTSQQNVSAKLDVLVFPFLDVYGLARIHAGNHQGTHPGPRRSHTGHHRAQGTAAQCRLQRPDLRRRRDPARAAPRSATGMT